MILKTVIKMYRGEILDFLAQRYSQAISKLLT